MEQQPREHWGWGVGVVANSMGCRVKVSTSFPPHFPRLVRVAPMMERYLNASLLGCVRAKMLLRIQFPKNAPKNSWACAK